MTAAVETVAVMTRITPLRHLSRAPRAAAAAIALALAAGLSGCADTSPSRSQPSFYDYLGVPGATVDAAMAASMISGYRANHGLGPVSVDPELHRLAAAQAAVMASRNDIRRALDGDRQTKVRLAKAGYVTTTAVENVSAGYRTLAEAFSGWRDSPPHNKNMLNPAVTRIGIGIAYAPDSKYKVFWSLILAAPASAPAATAAAGSPASATTAAASAKPAG